MVFELLCPLLPEHPQIVASGGALLNSPAWLQIISDVLGRPIAVSQAQEASGRGVALLALEALGNLEDLKAGPDLIGLTFDPDLRRHGLYREAMERQKDLYEKLVKE
jgi:gluconokinase